MTKQRKHASKLEALRRRIKAGDDALDRGDFVELDEADIDRYIARLTVTRVTVKRGTDSKRRNRPEP